jgi:hypothetical protein
VSAAQAFDPICAHVIETTVPTGGMVLPLSEATQDRFWRFVEHRRAVWAWRASVYRRAMLGAPRVRAGGAS